MISDYDIVCISTMDWDFLWTRKQRLMARLADQGIRVLYVNPRYASRAERLRPEHGVRGAYGFHVERVAENLWVMTPPMSLPLGRFQWSRNLSDMRRAKGIRQFLAEHKFQRPLLWVYPPTAIRLVERIPNQLVIYEIVDDYGENPSYDEGMRRYIRLCEPEMLKRADMVFVTSAELLKGRVEINPSIFVSSNGADVELFSRAQDPNLEVADDIRDLPRPVLGFVGGIAPWTDLDMVMEVAKRKPTWSIVLIGPVSRDVDLERFNDVKNVHFLGRRKPDKLPGYIKGMDVCLNLFKRTPRTSAVNPLKVYEYLAAGKPVVSTPSPEVEKFGELVSVGQDAEAFVSAAEQALSWGDDPDRIKARVRSVAEFSWDRILDDVIAKVNGLKQPTPGGIRSVEIPGDRSLDFPEAQGGRS